MKIRDLLLAGAVCASVCSVGASRPAAAGELDHLAGNWQGRGTVDRSDGTRENLRCQASYASAGSVSMSLKCASDSYNFELRSSIKNDSGKLSGTWSELTRRLEGSLSGKIDGDTMRATVNSDRFSAFMNVRTVGGNQAVTIESPGSTIAKVSISLRKS